MAGSSRFIPPLFVALWATGFIGARYAMPWSEPFSFLAVRFALAAALLAVLLVVMRTARMSWRQMLSAVFAGMLLHGIYLGGVFWAIRHGLPAGLTALIMGLQPMVTAIMAGLFLGERILPRHWLGLAIGFAGIVTVLGPRLGEAIGGVTGPTLSAVMIAVVSISAGTVWQKRFLTGVDLVPGTLCQYLGAAALMAVGSLAFETREFTPTAELFFAMAWSVVVLSLAAIFLLMHLIRHGEMAKVASLFYLVPAVTALMAWPLFGETLSLLQIVGMAVTTLGVALATVQRPMRARASR